MPLEPSRPPVNIYEGGHQLSVVMPIPGSHPDHVSVRLAPAQLRIRALCKYLQDSQHFHRHEWQVGSWEAEITLPAQVNPAHARATLNLGVLVVMAPLSDSDSVGGEREVKVE